MTGRVALVTGGAKGIGAAIAARLSQDGWRAVVADREPAGAAPAGGRDELCDVGDEAAGGGAGGGGGPRPRGGGAGGGAV